jgi:uncharacterized protein with FMN-binding domain
MRSRSTPPTPRLNPIPPRAAVAIVVTALGLVLLFSFKTPDTVPIRNTGGPASIGEAAGPSPTTAGVVGPSARPGPTSSPGRVGATPRPTANGGTITVTGDDVPNQFGDVQVQATFTNGKLTAVKALQLPFDRRRSAEISQYAEPVLRSEALQAQSAQIDLVSGATYTSDSYAQSLQSAIDKAHG